jgi:protein TonB
MPEPIPEMALPDSADARAGPQVDSPGAPTEATGPAVQIALVEDPEFYPARLLDVLPRPLAEVALRYPDSAATQDVSGRVVLLLLIDELGVVVEATVIEAEPPGYFEEAAIESFRDVLFQPAQRNGRAVKSRLPVEVTFDARTDSAKP